MPPVCPDTNGKSLGSRPNLLLGITASVPPPPASHGTQMNLELPRMPVVSSGLLESLRSWKFSFEALPKTWRNLESQPFNRDIESTSIGHDGIEAHRPLHPLAYSFPHFLCLLRCWGSGTATTVRHWWQHFGSHPCILTLPKQSNADASEKNLAGVERSGHHSIWIVVIFGIHTVCEVALTFAVQESGVAKSGRYYLMCEHQCSGCGRCFNAASSIHLHSPCHLVNLGHLDACSGLDADQRPGAPVRSDYHFLRTAFGGHRFQMVCLVDAEPNHSPPAASTLLCDHSFKHLCESCNPVLPYQDCY